MVEHSVEIDSSSINDVLLVVIGVRMVCFIIQFVDCNVRMCANPYFIGKCNVGDNIFLGAVAFKDMDISSNT